MSGTESAPDLTPYVPLLVRQWLNEPDPGVAHRGLDGSALFADISGFTKLSERLDRIGQEGAEQVTEVISNAFNRLLEPAYSYDGQLIKFGGDALLLFYGGNDHELRAASSALEMRRALRSMGPIVTPAGNVTLRMSQGVHTGTFHFFLVGSSFRELIMAGSDTTRVGRVEGEAGAGQIIVSEDTARALPSKNLGAQRETGRLLRGTLLPVEAAGQTVYAVEHDLTPFIPSALRDLIARDAVVSEHRPATAAFIRFSGADALLDKDPTAATEVFAELIDDVEAATAPRHIAILNTDVYPDGLKILLSAGAPITTGDDEENMLFALREVVSKERPLPLHIGVTRGPVFAGEVGTTFRRSYTVMGDQVNLAARLMSRAEAGQILATDPVLRGSRTIFGTTELEPFLVKGKLKPIQAFAVGEARGARSGVAGHDAPFLGRDDEMKTLLGIWEQTMGGKGSLVLVAGDRGSGKSRLMAEFASAAKAVDSYQSACRRYRASTPYFAVSLLLWEILGINRFDPERSVARLEQIVDAVDPSLMPYLSLIGNALGLDIPESQAVLALGDQFRKPRLEASVEGLLTGLLTEPTLLWIDDSQWMDDASADLFATLAAATGSRPWMLCVSGRGVTEGAADHDVVGPTITLDPLAGEDATAIVHQITEQAPLQPHVTAAIVERAQGNPMFLLELLGAMDEGDIDAMPDSIEAVIAARLDRLLPDDRAALRHLSVLGTGFRPEFAKVVLPEGAARAALPRLRDFLEVDREWVKFRNSLVHKAAYRGLPYRRRRELHARVAESIEGSSGGADLLSVHYFAAGRWPEAWQYSLAAGDHAKDIYANIEAAVLYERAIDSARWVESLEATDRAGVLESLGDVRELAGLYDESKDAYRRARGLLRGSRADEGRLALKEAFMRERQGELSQALRWIRRGHEALEGLDDREAAATRAQLTVWYATIRAYQGRLDDALEWTERGIEEASAADHKEALARAYLVRDFAEMGLGVSDGPSWTRKALEIYEELGDLAGVGTSSLNLGGYAYFSGEWDDACVYYERAEEVQTRMGNPVDAAIASGNIAEILSDQGHVNSPEPRLVDAHRIFAASGDPFGIAFTERLLAVGASRRRTFDEADALFDSARRGFGELGLEDEVFRTELNRADSLILRGDDEGALMLLDQMLETPDPTSELADFLITLHRLKGEALLRTGDLAGARVELELAERGARDDGLDFEVALTLTALERLDELEGTSEPPDRLRERDQILEHLGVVRLPELDAVETEERATWVAPS
ncbi:MAG: adenylate/guanylate cyclase domain-containing protein [Acidimicrobiia bacterium]|nr:MAG: adenylate/guanylate cyclase domain-containing protein [Acidimicrobiia bacterium]